ncbi:MAG: hypothetical protein B7Z02_14715 [Rhodobacterales bacterium 32-67-9]|nr:MAG: hypothetical protein B7Z02_14715 [Rhodobacterales bacterium 32-67-9]
MKPALLLLLALIVLGGMAWIRLAPSDPARWHVRPTGTPSPGGPLVPVEGGAKAALALPGETTEAVLTRLDAIARATPRTTRLAGSPEEGMITWITRSAIFGFPDYTTAAARMDGTATILALHARQRFGRRDFGVNAARLHDWLARLAP